MKGCRKTYQDIVDAGGYSFLLNLKISNPADRTIIKKLIELSNQGLSNKEALYSMIFDEKIERPEEKIKICNKYESTFLKENEDKIGVNSDKVPEQTEIERTPNENTVKTKNEVPKERKNSEVSEDEIALQKILNNMWGPK